jgi:hypothetical protein
MIASRRRDGAEHDRRVAAVRLVEEDARLDRSVEGREQVGVGGEDADAVRPRRGDVVRAPHRGVRRALGGDLLDRVEAGDHPRRRERQRRCLAEQRLAGRDREQVRSQLVELGEQVGLARLRDPEHGDHGGDAERDPDGRQGRPQAASSEPDRADAQDVCREQAAGLCHYVRASLLSSAIRPSRIVTWRVMAAATLLSCVMTTIVVPSRFSSCSREMISAPEWESRFPVGSSA